MATSGPLVNNGPTELQSFSADIPDNQNCGLFTLTDLASSMPVAKNEKVFISGTPTMPDLQAAFTGPPASTAVDMSLEVRYEVNQPQGSFTKFRNDETFFPEPEGAFNSFGGAHTWNLLTSYGNTFTGGDATFHYRLDPAGPVGDFPIKIRGDNPDDAAVISYIQSQDSFLYLPAMARQESFVAQAGPSFQFNQFNPPVFGNDALDNMPNYGVPDGWGIMQLDGDGLGRQITIEELWNWKISVTGGVAVLNTKRSEMNAYVNAVQNAFPAEFEDPFAPGAYTHDVTVNSTTYTLSFEEASLIQRYNRAANVVILDGQDHAATWLFDPGAPLGEKWSFEVNTNNYVFEVVEEFDALQGN